MKRTVPSLLSLAAMGLLLSACQQTVGSVSAENIAEMLQSPRMAITDSLPAWIHKKPVVSALDSGEIAQLRAILRPEDVRDVPEKYYRDSSAGNRGDDTEATFYLYGSNAQCLGGRVIDGKVLMDDFDLTDKQQEKLMNLLLPHLIKVGIVLSLSTPPGQ